MANGTKQIDISLIFILMGTLLIGCIVGFALTKTIPILALAVTFGIVIFTVSFVWPPIALYLLVFSMLLSPEFGQRETQGKGFTIRMDDLLLVILSFSWFLRSAIKKEYGLFPKTPLNRGIILKHVLPRTCGTWTSYFNFFTFRKSSDTIRYNTIFCPITTTNHVTCPCCRDFWRILT